MKLANEERFAVVARGAASGLTGGAVPAAGAVVADLTRMDKIIEIDRANLTALSEPGVVVSTLQEEVERLGLFYPPDPASNEFSTIGGNIAECAGGFRGLKYGVTRDYVLQLEAVTGLARSSGRVQYHQERHRLRPHAAHRRQRRDACDSDEGEAETDTAAGGSRDGGGVLRTPHAAGEAVSAMIESRLLPRALEFIDGATMDVVAKAKGYRFPQDARALLIIEMDGSTAQAAEDLRRAVDVARAKGSIAVEEAYAAADRERFWTMRKQISPSLYSASRDRVNEDICVPRSRIPEALDAIAGIAARHNLAVCNFAHAGDGNIHVNFLADLSNSAGARRGGSGRRGIQDGNRLGRHALRGARDRAHEEAVSRIRGRASRDAHHEGDKEGVRPERCPQPGQDIPQERS